MTATIGETSVKAITTNSIAIGSKVYNGIVVLTKDGCVPCKMTMKKLDKAGIQFDAVRMSDDENATADEVAAIEYARNLGAMGAPVVIVSDDNVWTQMRPDKIDELISSFDA